MNAAAVEDLYLLHSLMAVPIGAQSKISFWKQSKIFRKIFSGDFRHSTGEAARDFPALPYT